MINIKRKLKKFAVIISLIAAFSASCKKELTSQEYATLKPKIERVEKSLKKGNPDQKLNIELIRNIINLEREHKALYGFKNIEILPKFNTAVFNLKKFYEDCDFLEKELSKKGFTALNIVWGGPDSVIQAYDDLYRFKMTMGFVPEDEKNHLLYLIDTIIMVSSEEIENLPDDFSYGKKESIERFKTNIKYFKEIRENIKKL